MACADEARGSRWLERACREGGGEVRVGTLCRRRLGCVSYGEQLSEMLKQETYLAKTSFRRS